MFNLRIRGAVQSLIRKTITVNNTNMEKGNILGALTLSDLTDSVIFMSGQFDGFSKQLQEVLNSEIKEKEKKKTLQ